MAIRPRLDLMTLVAVVATGVLAVRPPSQPTSRPSSRPPVFTPLRARADTVDRSSIGFRTRELLIEHYRKHGRDFGAISMSEYLRQAQALRDRRPVGTVREAVRADGVIMRFDLASGAFLAFSRDGTIRTYFRPREGQTYFRRQIQQSGRRR